MTAGFNIRPFTKECLELANNLFEVAVFTASHKWYADVILDYIDPTNIYFQHRLYREHCIKSPDNVYIKDLRIFKNRDLKEVILVDNAVYSFGAQLSNGIPITPFKDDKEDKEFLHLMQYLENIASFEDCRILNSACFKLDLVYKFNVDKFIDYYSYDIADEDSGDDEESHDNSQSNLKPLPKSVEDDLSRFGSSLSILMK